MQWQGLLIGAPEGSQVHAVADGEVLFTAWMPHYGLVGIVDHGGGFLSLYGHNQALFRRPGERVRAGEVLGRVGTSGGQATPALYFEIRQGGNPVNPERWLAANRK
jgi:septal ring factor EnvC (AmiA/AmiB activator)